MEIIDGNLQLVGERKLQKRGDENERDEKKLRKEKV